jgi:hypothetical protein
MGGLDPVDLTSEVGISSKVRCRPAIFHGGQFCNYGAEIEVTAEVQCRPWIIGGAF